MTEPRRSSKTKTTLRVFNVTVLQNENGTDSVILTIDLPNGCYPYDGNATAEIKVASGKGEDYVKTNMNLQPRVIKV